MSPRKLYIYVVGAILLAAMLLRAWDPPPIARLRVLMFDVYQQIMPREPVAELPVRIVDIDEESLKRHGQWPWPRSLIAQLIDALDERGAAAVGFDIVFAEPDRLSPEQMVERSPQRETLRRLLSEAEGLKPHDEMLAQAMEKIPVVLGFIGTTAPGGQPPLAKAGFAHGGDGPKLLVPSFRGVTASLPMLQRAAAGNAALNWLPEQDQIVRRLPLLVSVGGNVYPALAPETLRVAQEASTFIVKSSGASGEQSFGASTAIAAIRIGEFTVPTDGIGRMWMWFTPSSGARYLPAWKLLAGQVSKEEVDGRIILVGTSAAGLFDSRATPLNASIPGVELHAQAIEQIVQQKFLQRPDFITAAEIAYILVLSLVIAWLVYALGAVGGAIVVTVGVVAVAILSWIAFSRLGWLIDPVYPTLSLASMYAATALNVYVRTERERNQVRGAFNRYMSPALVEKLADDPSRLKLGGETRNMTLMFADVRGFTSIAEGMSAEQLTAFVNQLFTPLSNVILEEGGTIDKYMGDAVMAFWNAPLDQDDHPRRACRTALKLIEAMPALNEEFRSQAEEAGRPVKPVTIGVGLNTGECCVGNLGSEKRFDYSVIGDNVNIASRLEGQTKTYGVSVVVGHATAKLVPDFAFLELDRLKMRGRSEPLRVFALLGDESVARLTSFTSFKPLHVEMLGDFRAGKFEAAEHMIGRCERLQGFGLERYYEAFRKRIAAFRNQPPPSNWDGSMEAESK